MNDTEFVTVWDGEQGWAGSDRRGELLPPYNSATTLTVAVQDPFRHASERTSLLRGTKTVSPRPVLKLCSRCRLVKAISEFYAHGQMGDGLQSRCKACTRLDVARRRYRACAAAARERYHVRFAHSGI